MCEKLVIFFYFCSFPEVLQCQVDVQSGQSKLLTHLSAPKVHLYI